MILNEEFLRMQKLAGVQSNDIDLDQLSIEALTEYYLYINYYSKGVLAENLDEGIFDKAKEKAKEFAEKLKSKAEKLKLPPSSAILTSLLTGLKKELGEVTFDKIIAIADKFKGNPKDKKEVMDYLEKEIGDLSEQPDLKEGIFDLFRNKKTGKASGLSKTILIALAMLISFKAVGADKIIKSSIGKVPPSTETSSDTLKQQGVSDKNIKTWSDVEKEANKQVSDQTDTTKGDTTNTVNSEDGGKTIKVGFNTGDFKVTDEDGTAKKIADEIIKQAGGKNIKDLTLGVKGLISNTPGAGDDDPNGPGKDGLGEKRLEAAKSLAQKVSDLLKAKYKDIKVTIDDEGTNVTDPGPEVKANSDGAKKNQASSFTIKNLKTDDGKKAPTATPSPDFNPVTYFKNPKLVSPDANKLHTIVGYILPLIVDDTTYEDFFKRITDYRNKEAKGATVEKVFNRTYIENLLKKDKTELENAGLDDNSIKMLQWAVMVDRNAKTEISKFIKTLDPEISLASTGTKFTPGAAGKAASTTGAGTEAGSTNISVQSPVGGQPVSEFKLFSIYESLILEATSNWYNLPGFNKAKAESKLGEILPIFIYTWNLEPTDVLDRVMDDPKYKESFNKFANSYPEFKVKYGSLIKPKDKDTQEPTAEPTDKKAKTDQKTGDKYPFDKNEKPTAPDIVNLVKATNRDNAYKQYLNKINTVDELANFILALFLYRDKQGGKLFNTDKTFTTDTGKAKSALFAVSNRLQNLQEDETDPVIKKYNDVKNTYIRVGQSSTLRNALSKINNSEEFAQFILRAVFPYVDKNLHSDRSKLRQAITKAANSTKEYADILKKNTGKSAKTTDVNLSEEFTRMNKLAGIKK